MPAHRDDYVQVTYTWHHTHTHTHIHRHTYTLHTHKHTHTCTHTHTHTQTHTAPAPSQAYTHTLPALKGIIEGGGSAQTAPHAHSIYALYRLPLVRWVKNRVSVREFKPRRLQLGLSGMRAVRARRVVLRVFMGGGWECLGHSLGVAMRHANYSHRVWGVLPHHPLLLLLPHPYCLMSKM